MNHGEWEPLAALRALIQLRYEQGNWHAWRQQTPQLTQALRALSLAQARAFAQELWAHPSREALTPFLGQLNTTVSGALSDLSDAFVTQQVFWPSWLYLDAPWTTTQHLLRLLDDPAAQEQRHLLLLALAWVDDDLVHTQFQAWRVHPPHWQAEEFLALQEYATRAGWELTPDGGRRQLYRSTSYELVPVDEPELAPSAQAVAVSTPHEASCGWCGRELVTLLEIDLGDPRCAFVVGQMVSSATRLRIAHCLWCSTYGTLYTDIDLFGRSAWSAANEDKPRLLEWMGNGAGEEMPEPARRRLALGPRRRTPFEAVGRFSLDETGVSQIGGHPEWIQDSAYPVCRGCRQRMECIGQVSWEDLDEDAEGCTYAFLCLPCGKAATTYQQT